MPTVERTILLPKKNRRRVPNDREAIGWWLAHLVTKESLIPIVAGVVSPLNATKL
jgi:hypothetical protein